MIKFVVTKTINDAVSMQQLARKVRASHKSDTDHGNLYENKHQDAPSHRLPCPASSRQAGSWDGRRKHFLQDTAIIVKFVCPVRAKLSNNNVKLASNYN